MAIVKRFKWTQDEEYGNWGWLDVNAPSHFNTGDGRLIAHDFLEHIGTRLSNTNEDEIVALGAAVFIRGVTGMLNGHYSWQENIASDLCQEFNNIISGEQRFNPPITNRLCCENTDQELEGAVDIAAKMYMTEYEGKMPSKKIRKGVLSFLRIGYRKAEKRYQNSYWAADLFREIQEESDRLSKFAEEGLNELKITLNLKEMEVKVELIDVYDEYY